MAIPRDANNSKFESILAWVAYRQIPRIAESIRAPTAEAMRHGAERTARGAIHGSIMEALWTRRRSIMAPHRRGRSWWFLRTPLYQEHCVRRRRQSRILCSRSRLDAASR